MPKEKLADVKKERDALLVQLKELQQFGPEPDEPEEPELPPAMAALDEIRLQNDTEEKTFRSDDAFNYVISRVYKSKKLDKKVVVKSHFMNLIEKELEEEKRVLVSFADGFGTKIEKKYDQLMGRAVIQRTYHLYSYNEDIGPQEMNIIGSKYIEHEIPTE